MSKIEKLLDIIKEKNIDAMYITKESNVKYVTGYPDELAYAIICQEGKFVITDSRFTELAETSCPGFEIINWHLYDRSIPKAIESICEKMGIKRLGFEECFTTYDKYSELASRLEVHGTEMVPVRNVIEELRYTKSNEEILLIHASPVRLLIKH